MKTVNFFFCDGLDTYIISIRAIEINIDMYGRDMVVNAFFQNNNYNDVSIFGNSGALYYILGEDLQSDNWTIRFKQNPCAITL
jgi:hypothetical protein